MKTILINLVIAAVSSAFTYILASFFSTHFVLNGLGVPISLSDRISMTMSDLMGTYFFRDSYFIGSCIAFIVAVPIRRTLKAPYWIAYSVAGASAIATALGLMYFNFETIPINGG